ncbi:MAG: transmembrane anchor protein [Pseudomonadota bacterium]|nr:transmembrane anchor protein [Pseudomonadota bacterium]
MFNSNIPSKAELPSTQQLIKSTVIALVAAIIMLVAVILPAEYAVDPTGIGRVLGLTEMGEIKTQLAEEALLDEQLKQSSSSNQVITTDEATPSNDDMPAASEWRDKTVLLLQPGQGAEIKMVMNKGQIAEFEWSSNAGGVNYDTHGDGNGNSISYEKGRGVQSDEGSVTAAFNGNHGWFFRNRNDKPVMVVLNTKGEYKEIKRVM